MVIGYFAIALLLWLASAIYRAAKETKRNKEIARINREQAKAKLQADLFRQEWKRQQAEAKAETARLIALERESMRMAKEQERQAAILEKHEKRIAALECKVRKLDRDIEAQGELLADYYAQLDWLLLQQSGTVTGGSEFAKWQNKIVTKNNQIRKAENKIADMKDAKTMAEREMVA